MSSPFEVLFTVTLYRDGAIQIGGRGRHSALPDILRMIAASLENGATVLRDEGEDIDLED